MFCAWNLFSAPPVFLVAWDLSLCWRYATDFHANHLWGLFQIYTNGSLQSCNFLYTRILRMLGWLVAQVDVRVKYVILWHPNTLPRII
jgi:hypothetical protein